MKQRSLVAFAGLALIRKGDFSPPEKDRDSPRAAATRARMTNAKECVLFLSFPRVAAARGIPTLLR